jgi:hypothetical protein
MNQAELWAYGQVAETLTKHAYISALESGPLDWPSATKPTEPVYFHQCSSAFEWTTQNLWRLGILKNVRDGEPGLPTHSVFTCAPAEAHMVAMKNWNSGSSLNDLIENFLYLVGDYGSEYWGLSTEPNKAFGKGSRIEAMLDALAGIGYLDKIDDGFVWTQRAAEAMYKTGRWPDPASTT